MNIVSGKVVSLAAMGAWGLFCCGAVVDRDHGGSRVRRHLGSPHPAGFQLTLGRQIGI
jgi:hypothetical protein